jgi:hypothetical protein
MSLFPLHQGGRAGKTNAANSCDSVGGCGVISLWHQKRDVKKKRKRCVNKTTLPFENLKLNKINALFQRSQTQHDEMPSIFLYFRRLCRVASKKINKGIF